MLSARKIPWQLPRLLAQATSSSLRDSYVESHMRLHAWCMTLWLHDADQTCELTKPTTRTTFPWAQVDPHLSFLPVIGRCADRCGCQKIKQTSFCSENVTLASRTGKKDPTGWMRCWSKSSISLVISGIFAFSSARVVQFTTVSIAELSFPRHFHIYDICSDEIVDNPVHGNTLLCKFNSESPWFTSGRVFSPSLAFRSLIRQPPYGNIGGSKSA